MLKIYLINLLLIIFFVAAHFEEPIHKSNVLTTKNNFQVDRSSLDNQIQQDKRDNDEQMEQDSKPSKKKKIGLDNHNKVAKKKKDKKNYQNVNKSSHKIKKNINIKQSSIIQKDFQRRLNDIKNKIGINQNRQISVLIVGRVYKKQTKDNLIQNVIQILSKIFIPKIFLIDQKELKAIRKKYPHNQIQKFVMEQHQNIIDYIITLGGDGTILYTARYFKNRIPPFITFQGGTIGFLCRFFIPRIPSVLLDTAAYFFGQNSSLFKAVNVIRLHGTINFKNGERKQKICMNQIQITTKKSDKILVQIYINNKYLTKVKGKGVLISTPTGSTGYALAIGGPLIQNNVNCILLMPVFSDSLASRPICLSPESQIKIKIHRSSKQPANVKFDWYNEQQLGMGEQLIIKKAKHSVVFLQYEEEYLTRWPWKVKKLLSWNRSYKNSKSQFGKLKDNKNG